jgi:predicted ester cyclase
VRFQQNRPAAKDLRPINVTLSEMAHERIENKMMQRLFGSGLAIVAFFVPLLPAVASSNIALSRAGHVVVDPSLPKAQADAQILAALRYDTFWNTGDPALAKLALAPDFTDRTLPSGRVQGISGALAASATVRQAVPDLTCEIEQMLVVGDRVVTHLHFHGHFTGHFVETQGRGQSIDFVATDIYRIAKGRIHDNWHIEDTLTFLRQLGVVAK